MRRNILIILLLTLMMTSCDERFMSWKDYNETWLEAQRDKLGEDPEVLEVEIMPSGVLIEKYHTGYGAIPKPTVDPTTQQSSIVKVKYRGYLVDGTMFESSDISAFPLASVIDGWQEALSKMPQGSHWKIYIPAEKAYGRKGSKGAYKNFVVPPHSTLIFDIDLVDVINF